MNTQLQTKDRKCINCNVKDCENMSKFSPDKYGVMCENKKWFV